jgi:hypothetical protein
VLGQIAAQEGIDFATALLYDRLRRSPEHGPVIRRVEEMAPPEPAELDGRNITVAVVPGAFYVEYPHSGAGGQQVQAEATRFGCRTALIPTRSFGALRENGRIICDWLGRCPEQRIVLVSLSKGGADVKSALEEPDAGPAFRKVIAWVSLSGIVKGTPLVGWLLSRRLRTWMVRLLFWYRGYHFAVVRELGRDPAGPLGGTVRVPGHLRVIHVAGFPLQCHLSKRLMRRGFRRLAPWGPNDGGVLLADVCALPGVIYPVWGADHYLRPAGSDLRQLFARLLRLIIGGKESP